MVPPWLAGASYHGITLDAKKMASILNFPCAANLNLEEDSGLGDESTLHNLGAFGVQCSDERTAGVFSSL